MNFKRQSSYCISR